MKSSIPSFSHSRLTNSRNKSKDEVHIYTCPDVNRCNRQQKQKEFNMAVNAFMAVTDTDKTNWDFCVFMVKNNHTDNLCACADLWAESRAVFLF